MGISKHVYLLAIIASIVLLLNISRVSHFHLPSSSIVSDRSLRLQRLQDTGRKKAQLVSSSSFSSSSPKPWPSLASYLSWLRRPDLPPRSCEAYFGNGFIETIRVFPAEQGLPDETLELRQQHAHIGSLSCLYSETLRTSICEAWRVVMDPARIRMSPGGEPLESVIGRTDADELPTFSPGAVQIAVQPSQAAADWTIPGQILDTVMPQGQILDHRLRALFTNIRIANSDQVSCLEEIKEPTLFIIRYEYANLFHTATDWYSAYVTSRVLNLQQRPNVVFVDGHCQSPMDDGWKALFSNIYYAKNFTGPVCFNNVIFTPLGYETAIFKGLNSGIGCKGCPATELKQSADNSKTARLREFSEMFKAAFGVLDIKRGSVKNILFVRRESYLAHPRHAGRPEVRLQNEQELFNSLETWAQNKGNVKIINGTLAHMTMKEQVQAVHDAAIILGVHGAGLTHILFAQPGTAVLELLSPLFPRPHYAHISQWMGMEYHSITMPGTHADCPQVLQHLSQILDNIQTVSG